LNTKVMKGYGKSRLELFNSFDRPVLKALPATPYEWRIPTKPSPALQGSKAPRRA
jgi:hypothetical protein